MALNTGKERQMDTWMGAEFPGWLWGAATSTATNPDDSGGPELARS